jgi:hypothetical protein
MVALLLLLAGAAFVGGHLLSDREHDDNSTQKTALDSDVLKVIVSAEPLDIRSAEEMPDTPLDVTGLFVRCEDSSLFVGTGNLSGVVVDSEQGSASWWEYHHDGPVVEVVTTHDTLIYRDDTSQQFMGSLPSGPIQQVLTPSALDEIGRNSIVSTWGEKRGDRIVAEVVVFSTVAW